MNKTWENMNLMEGRITEENSTYLQYLRLDKSPKEYELIKQDFLSLVNGDQLSPDDPFFPAPKRRRRQYAVKFEFKRSALIR